MASGDDRNQNQNHPQLKGFVIITLPPSNNPSFGKTITAFTLSDDHPPPPPPSPSPPPPSRIPLSLHQGRLRTDLSANPRRRISWTLLGISLFAILTICSIHSSQRLSRLASSWSLNEVDQNDDDDNDKNPNSFIFPLYPKSGVGEEMSKMRDMEVKLGKFSMFFGSKSSVLPLDDGVLHSKVSISSNSAVLPINGDTFLDGLYYTQILIGSPPRPYFLDIDTGSDLTWIQCDAPCTSCAKGMLLNSLAQTDGILGLSRAKVSMPSQLAKEGVIENVIGHCLMSASASGGYMFLGVDFVPQVKMSWVPMLNDASMNYIAEVSRVTYGSKQLGLDRQKKGNGRMVFDSGSSYTYFTKQAYLDLASMLKDVSRDGFIEDASDTTMPICWQPKTPIRSIKDVSKFFKPLTIHFWKKWWSISTYLHIPPEGYLIKSNKGNVCLGILDGSDLLDGSHIVLGDISMRGNLIVYDNVKQKIGWMRSECVNPKQSNKDLPSF